MLTRIQGPMLQIQYIRWGQIVRPKALGLIRGDNSASGKVCARNENNQEFRDMIAKSQELAIVAPRAFTCKRRDGGADSVDGGGSEHDGELTTARTSTTAETGSGGADADAVGARRIAEADRRRWSLWL
ncbi:hypothetical protein F2Q69_00022927 [Brassica cretica]|uniref:Uncharacterized protein n=1 Tax=Brassica cretica TaxID=69181 RepID=A0A8S9Q9Z2_BRACR|nr:hypothetical protein F2Q69_00022927 [Brassica cretica]